MSEFKFACPVCGQHITCDSRTSGTQMECPTCFRKLVIPQPPAAGSSNLLLTASEVTNRPLPTVVAESLAGASSKKFPFAAVALLVVLCAVGGTAFVFRDKILKLAQGQPAADANSAAKEKTKAVTKPFVPPANDTNWTLLLAGVKVPDGPAMGRINGHGFTLERATLQGGRLDLRQDAVGLTIHLFANQGEDLAGQSISIDASRPNAPRVVLRWKDEEEKSRTKTIRAGYALRLDFGHVTGKRIPGKLYLVTPDDAKSYVAGTFDAEIRKPAPPKPKQPPSPKPKQ